MKIHLKKPNISSFWHLDKLFLNHMDAWGVTAVIVATALSIHELVSGKNLFLLVIIVFTYWFGFALNDYYDRQYDEHDPNKADRNFFIQHHLPPTLFKLLIPLIVIGLLFSFFSFGWRGWSMFVLGIFVAWAYSAPPLRFKSRPGLDLLIHAVFVESFPYLLVLIILNVSWQPIDVIIFSALIFASLASQLEQQARDYIVDSQTDRNFTVRFGIQWNQRLMIFSTLLLISVIGFGLFTRIIPLIYSPFAAIMLPLLLHRLFRGAHPRSERGVKALTAVAMVYALFLIGVTQLS